MPALASARDVAGLTIHPISQTRHRGSRPPPPRLGAKVHGSSPGYTCPDEFAATTEWVSAPIVQGSFNMFARPRKNKIERASRPR